MKMMSSTSITSTSGTTLISGEGGRHLRPAPPAGAAVPDAPAATTLGMAASSYVKLRSAMVRNSIEKSSIAVANCFTWWAKWL